MLVSFAYVFPVAVGVVEFQLGQPYAKIYGNPIACQVFELYTANNGRRRVSLLVAQRGIYPLRYVEFAKGKILKATRQGSKEPEEVFWAVEEAVCFVGVFVDSVAIDLLRASQT